MARRVRKDYCKVWCKGGGGGGGHRGHSAHLLDHGLGRTRGWTLSSYIVVSFM